MVGVRANRQKHLEEGEGTAMKTVPTVRLADTPDAAGLPDLPEEVRVAMADIAGAAREGLLAMSVAAGMAVMAAMFEAEIAGRVGRRASMTPGRAAVRHGTGKGSVTLGGRRVPVDRPRARTVDGHEVPLSSYSHFAADDLLAQLVMERMLAGVATRRHVRVAEPLGAEVEARRSRRAARHFAPVVKQTETALAELMARDLSGLEVKVIMIDGSTWPTSAWWWPWPSPPMGPRCRWGCGSATPRTRPWCAACWPTWPPGACADGGLLAVLDGAKALAAAVREVFGASA